MGIMWLKQCHTHLGMVYTTYGCRSKWKTDVGPQMEMSSLVLTIQLLGYLILTHTHIKSCDLGDGLFLFYPH